MQPNNTLKIPINHEKKILLFSDIIYCISNSIKIYFRTELESLSDVVLSNIITDLYEEYNDYEFWWLNAHEAGIKFFENKEIQKTIKLFEKFNLKNKLLFIDNNLGIVDYRGENRISVPGMIGFTSHMGFDITERKFEKKFISLNRIPKSHRRNIFKFLKENYFHDSYLSFAPNHLNDVDRLVFDEVEKISHGNMLHAWPHEVQKKSFCNIVTESLWFSGPIHITEKIDKCFSAGQPFVLVAGSGYLKKLKELGFKTFDKWWDESYDDEDNNYRRMKKIKQTINYIGDFSINECERIYLDMIPMLKHNKELSKEYSNDLYFNFNWKNYDIKPFHPKKNIL